MYHIPRFSQNLQKLLPNSQILQILRCFPELCDLQRLMTKHQLYAFEFQIIKVLDGKHLCEQEKQRLDGVLVHNDIVTQESQHYLQSIESMRQVLNQ